MIKINLLPPEAGKRPTASKARGAASSRVSNAALPFLLMCFLGLGAGAYYAYTTVTAGLSSADDVIRERKKTADTKKKVDSRREEFARNNALSQEIEEKYQVLKALSPDKRVFWSEKLNMLAQARLSKAVYLTKMQLEETVSQIETPESVAKREAWKKRNAARSQGSAGVPNAGRNQQTGVADPEPKPITRPVINQNLTVQAIAYGTDSSQRLQQINQFTETLRNMDWTRVSGEKTYFLESLNPQFQLLDQKVAKVGGVEVVRFGLRITANPQTEDTQQAAQAARNNPNLLAGVRIGTQPTTATKPAAKAKEGK